MGENWLREYIFLAFRIHKLAEATYGSPFVETYYGPPEWRTQIESEPEATASRLVRQAISLADALPGQAFTQNREIYLAKHVKAMETLCRKLCGESFSLEEEARYFLDISPTWTPEEQFEQAHALYEEVLPGTGSLAQRLQAYRAEIAYPQEQAIDLARYIDQAFIEARIRTQRLIELPAGEDIDIHYLPEWEYDAAAYYQGSYRTRIVINTSATAKHISRLFDHKICHEGYPGHHTEYILKEQHLYRQQAYTEQSICLTLSPQCVIQEGIAMLAHEMIFAEGEAEQWLVEHVYFPLKQDVDATVLLRLRQASQMLGGVWDNAAFMLDEGRPEEEVIQYFARYLLLAEDRAAAMVTFLKHPMGGPYNLAYVAGQRLMRPLLKGPGRSAMFRRLLTEQFTPSQLKDSVPPLHPE